MMAKIKQDIKEHLPNILIILCAAIALVICMAVTENGLRESILRQWSDTLDQSAHTVAAGQPADETAILQQLKKTYDNLYIGKEKVYTVAFFRRTTLEESNTVFYSTAEWCQPGMTVQGFFQSVDAYGCYNAIIRNESGYYKHVTVEGSRYYVLYTALDGCQVSVIEFVPESAMGGLVWSYRLGSAVLIVILIVLVCIYLKFSLKEKLRLANELQDTLQTMHDKNARMDILSYLMNEFTFEYDIEKDTLTFAEKYQTIFQRGKNFIRFKETLRSHYVVYHMDMDNLLAAYDDIMNGKEEGSVLFRLQMTGGNYEWFNAVYKVMYNKDHAPSFVVGKMMNVHKSQTEKEMLLKKSTRDPLTNLLNRSEMEKRTTTYIEGMDSEDMAALLIMDLDHFKQVNDTFGHSKGDDLLREVAAVIRDSFRTNDIIARLGGDEFFVFMKDIASEKDAVNKCEKLRLALSRDVTYGDNTVSISASMGIIFVRENAQFLDIYMKADSALYRAKENGRNQICIYSDEGIGHKEEQ